jgi:hypothetical protein
VGGHDPLVRSISFTFLLLLTVSRSKARNRLCQDKSCYGQHDEFKSAMNETLSVNWPYKPEETVIKIAPSEYAINPVFVTHLRNLDNWTVGVSFLSK